MNQKTTGGPAFPIQFDDGSFCLGMTLRDHFAGQALASINLGIGVSDEYYSQTAKHCYALADAMLKARDAA